jgi:hypothetical protein
LVCCLSYREVGDRWVEYFVPFDEWRKYLQFKMETSPTPLPREAAGDRFDFIRTLDAALRAPSLNASSSLLSFAETVELMEGNSLTQKGEEWLKKTDQEKAMDLYFQILSLYRYHLLPHSFSDRDLREVEKNVKNVLSAGWIYFDEFVKGVTAAIGECKPVSLQQKGKRWAYALPSYNPDQLAFVHKVIFEHLYRCGIVAVDTHGERPIFCVTPFGKSLLSD